jgi:hypothetical protein
MPSALVVVAVDAAEVGWLPFGDAMGFRRELPPPHAANRSIVTARSLLDTPQWSRSCAGVTTNEPHVPSMT